MTDKERERYQRQLLIPGWGEEGQEKLKGAAVFVAGTGGLGSPVSLYLAYAGVGTIYLCDNGELELSNMNRQVLYTEADVGKKKVEAAAERLRSANGDITVVPVTERIDEESSGIIDKADLIVDCLDNFAARYILNRYAVKKSVPFLHAGVAGFAGQMTFIRPGKTACLACVFPEVPESKGAIPIMGATAGVIGSLAAVEVCKHITGIGGNLENRLLIWDGEEQVFDTVEIEKNSDCPVCGREK